MVIAIVKKDDWYREILNHSCQQWLTDHICFIKPGIELIGGRIVNFEHAPQVNDWYGKIRFAAFNRVKHQRRWSACESARSFLQETASIYARENLFQARYYAA